MRRNEAGLTIVELLIVMVVTLIVTGTVLSFAINFWSINATLQNDLETLVTRADAGDSLREALNVSSGLIMQNSIADSHPMVSDPDDATGQYWKPIHAIPGSTPVGAAGTMTPLIYFESPATDTAKNILFNGAQPYTNEFVLYLNGTTKQLLLRTLANPAASGNRVRTSCPPSDASASCPADRIIADNISSVDMRYFSRSGNLIDWQSIVETDAFGNPVVPTTYIGPDFTSVEVVEFNLHLFKKSTIQGGQDTINSTIIRVAIRNR